MCIFWAKPLDLAKVDLTQYITVARHALTQRSKGQEVKIMQLSDVRCAASMDVQADKSGFWFMGNCVASSLLISVS